MIYIGAILAGETKHALAFEEEEGTIRGWMRDADSPRGDLLPLRGAWRGKRIGFHVYDAPVRTTFRGAMWEEVDGDWTLQGDGTEAGDWSGEVMEAQLPTDQLRRLREISEEAVDEELGVPEDAPAEPKPPEREPTPRDRPQAGGRKPGRPDPGELLKGAALTDPQLLKRLRERRPGVTKPTRKPPAKAPATATLILRASGTNAGQSNLFRVHVRSASLDQGRSADFEGGRASLANLPAGSYQLHIDTKGKMDLPWGPEPSTLAVTLRDGESKEVTVTF